MDWRSRLNKKLVELDTALAHVHSGAVVNVAPYSCTPVTLCEGLKAYGTRAGLTDVRIEHLAAFVSWTDSDELRATFRLLDKSPHWHAKNKAPRPGFVLAMHAVP